MDLSFVAPVLAVNYAGGYVTRSPFLPVGVFAFVYYVGIAPAILSDADLVRDAGPTLALAVMAAVFGSLVSHLMNSPLTRSYDAIHEKSMCGLVVLGLSMAMISLFGAYYSSAIFGGAIANDWLYVIAAVVGLLFFAVGVMAAAKVRSKNRNMTLFTEGFLTLFFLAVPIIGYILAHAYWTPTGALWVCVGLYLLAALVVVVVVYRNGGTDNSNMMGLGEVLLLGVLPVALVLALYYINSAGSAFFSGRVAALTITMGAVSLILSVIIMFMMNGSFMPGKSEDESFEPFMNKQAPAGSAGVGSARRRTTPSSIELNL